jgi:hypothetical protein
MLSHPLSRARLAGLAAALDGAAAMQALAVGYSPGSCPGPFRSSPGPPAAQAPAPPTALGGGGGGDDADADCRASLVFAQLLAGALPLLAQAWCVGLPRSPAAAPPAAAPAGGAPATLGLPARAACAARAADRFLGAVAGAGVEGGTRMLCTIMVLLPLLWSAARAAAGA